MFVNDLSIYFIIRLCDLVSNSILQNCIDMRSTTMVNHIDTVTTGLEHVLKVFSTFRMSK